MRLDGSWESVELTTFPRAPSPPELNHISPYTLARPASSRLPLPSHLPLLSLPSSPFPRVWSLVMASLSSMAVRKPSVVRSLPGRLPLLLIGSGLANASLARTLSVHGYSDEDQHFRMFDQHSAHHQTSYALNVQSWATDGLDHLVRRGRPKHGDQPGFVHSATVDAQHGGKGGVRPQLLSITTNQAVADLQGVSEGTNVAATQARVKSGVFLRSVKANVPVQYNKKFVDFEHLVDENGREAVKAWFEDGSSAIGSAIIGGDGVRSKGELVASSLTHSHSPIKYLAESTSFRSPLLCSFMHHGSLISCLSARLALTWSSASAVPSAAVHPAKGAPRGVLHWPVGL